MADNSLTYYLKDGKYIYYSLYDDEGQRCSNSTRIKVTKVGDITSIQKHQNNKLKIAVSQVDKHIGMLRMASLPVLKEEIDHIILDALDIKKVIKRKTVDDILTDYMEGAKTGKILKPKDQKRYSPSWLRTAKHMHNKIKEEGKFIKRNIEQVRPVHLKEIQSFLVRDGRSQNTIATYNNLLVSILRHSKKELNWHGNKMLFDEALHIQGEEVDYPIVYSMDEIQTLIAHDFEGIYDRVRDIFVFGCFMFHRYIDYYQTDYTKSVYNGRVVYETEKTDHRVEIPLHPIAKGILEKYNYNLPKISYTRLKDYVKDITRIAGFRQNELFSRMQGGTRLKEYREKWELTTTHTMRRTAATNAVLSGMPLKIVQKLGGWKTEKSLLHYIKIKYDDLALVVNKSKFYTDAYGIQDNEHTDVLRQLLANGTITKEQKYAIDKCIASGMSVSYDNGEFIIRSPIITGKK